MNPHNSQNTPAEHRTGNQSALPATKYILRVHSVSQENRDFHLVDEIKIMSNHEIYKYQHQISAQSLTTFIQQFKRVHPNVTVERANSVVQQPNNTSSTNMSQNTMASAVSTLAYPSGYDKFDSSYGLVSSLQNTNNVQQSMSYPLGGTGGNVPPQRREPGC